MTFRNLRITINVVYLVVTLLVAGLWVNERYFTTFEDIVVYPSVALIQTVFRSTEPVKFLAFANATHENAAVYITDQVICLNDVLRWERSTFSPTKTIVVEALDKDTHPANIIQRWIDNSVVEPTPADITSKMILLGIEYGSPYISYSVADFTENKTCRFIITMETRTVIFEFSKKKTITTESFDIRVPSIYNTIK